MTKDTKIKCIKNLPPFIEGVEYSSDSRLLSNISDSNDKQVLIIESENNDDTNNCYLLPLDKVWEHFIVID